MVSNKVIFFLIYVTMSANTLLWAQVEQPVAETVSHVYKIQAGDVIQVYVWKETELQRDVLVMPDGRISLPLVGEVQAAGLATGQLTQEITKRLKKLMPDVVVNVNVKALSGNKIYIIGKVLKPGEYVLNRPVDVLQALSMAAGVDRFAAENSIKILRREADQRQTILHFEYNKVISGKKLEQNILLQSGDVIVVP